MEWFYTHLILTVILFVFSILCGAGFLIFEKDYYETRFVESIVLAVVTLLLSLGHYISAQIKENKEESRKNPNRRSHSQ